MHLRENMTGKVSGKNGLKKRGGHIGVVSHQGFQCNNICASITAILLYPACTTSTCSFLEAFEIANESLSIVGTSCSPGRDLCGQHRSP